MLDDKKKLYQTVIQFEKNFVAELTEISLIKNIFKKFFKLTKLWVVWVVPLKKQNERGCQSCILGNGRLK